MTRLFPVIGTLVTLRGWSQSPRSIGAAPLRALATLSGTEQILGQLINYEQSGVPTNAGQEGPDGFDLGRIHRLLSLLGEPHKALPTVHISGTKGKGSVSAMLSNILQQSGYSVGCYTSPHIVSIRERIAVNGSPISQAKFEQLIAAHASSLETAQQDCRGALSHFEAMTALALKHFHDLQVDVAVVETGLGGTTDATNVFDSQSLKLAVITAIGLEHQAALGGNLHTIAQAKAGIMKTGRAVVIGRQPETEAAAVLHDAAASLGCPVIEAPREVQLEFHRTLLTEEGVRQACTMNLHCADNTQWHGEVEMQLLGAHQLDNAATASAAALELREQGFEHISPEGIVAGLEQTFLPGRFQVIKLHGSDNGAKWLVLDGAHTAESARALAHTMRQVFPENALAMVLAMADDKDHRGFLANLRTAGPNVVLFTSTPIAGAAHRSAAPGTLAAHWQAAAMTQPAGQRQKRCRELIQASVQAAVEKATLELKAHPGQGVICVTGSLYALKEALNFVPE